MAADFNIGKFNRKVSFQTATSSKTSGGGIQKTFSHSFYGWCERVMNPNVTEQYSNQRITVPYEYVYRTHYRSGIDETMRIVDGSVSYNILAVISDDNKMFIELPVEKVTE